jgi:Zn-dependent alcohol dehydrogenase
MRAAVMTEPDRTLELRDRSPRRLPPTRVHVRINASGVCHSDETIRRQGMGGPAPVIHGHKGAGTVVAVCMPPSGTTVEIDGYQLLSTEKRPVGCYYGSGQVRRDFPRLVALAEAGRLDLAGAVTRRIRLDQVNEARAAMAGGEVIRSVIRPGGGAD